MMEIKLTTYEEDRLNYFFAQRNRIQGRYERLGRIVDSKEPLPYLSEDLEILSALGRELSFYNDVVEMLEKDLAEREKDG